MTSTPLKVAHVTATFPPYWAGTGNVAYHNARLLHERGHQVTVFTAATPRDHELAFDFEVRRLPAHFRVGNAPLTPGLLDELRGFDLIHLHYPYIFGAELAALAARRWHTPLAMTYHNDLLAGGLRGGLFRAYNALNQPALLRQADLLIATSADYARHSLFARTASARTRLATLPNGVDTASFRPQERSETPYALLVGGLDSAHHFKGVPVLLEALAQLPGARAVIVGDGDLRAEFEARAEQLAPGRVRFAGRVPHDELVRLYAQAAVTVLPSTTQGEAFGMVLIESLACATPVIASNLPGVRTVVQQGETGLLVEPHDAAGLAEALSRILEDPAFARRLGECGMSRVRRLYDWNVIGDRLEGLYRDLLSGRVGA